MGDIQLVLVDDFNSVRMMSGRDEVMTYTKPGHSMHPSGGVFAFNERAGVPYSYALKVIKNFLSGVVPGRPTEGEKR